MPKKKKAASGIVEGNVLNYRPRVTQIPYLTNPRRNDFGESFLIVHRRGGKSEGAIVLDLCQQINELLTHTEIPIVGKDVRLEYPKICYFAETKTQARSIIWTYILKFLSLFPRVKFNAHQMVATIERPKIGDYITVALRAYRDYDQVRGEKYYRIYCDEYALAPRAAWPVIYPTLIDLEGHCIKFGTPMGRDNILYEEIIRHLAEGGRSVWRFPASQTGVIPQESLEKYRREVGHEAYMREMECDFSIAFGPTYFGDLITKYYPDRQMPVHYNMPLILAADIGVGKSFAAFLAAYVNEERLLLIDYYTGYDSVTDLQVDIKNDWGRDPDHIILPHDSVQKKLAYRTLHTTKDIFRLCFPNAGYTLLTKVHRIEHDILQVKENIHVLWYLDQDEHPTDLPTGLRLVKQWGPKISDANVIIAPTDKKNPANHAADAFRYLVIGMMVKRGKVNRILAGTHHGEREQPKMRSWARGTRPARHLT